MNSRVAIFIILLGCFMLSSCCGQGESLAEGFAEYNSTEVITEYPDASDRIPIFSVKYPPDWKYGWVGDSGVIALLISSGDVNSAFYGQDDSGAFMMIIPAPYSGEKLTDMFYTTLDAHIPLEPSQATSINGQDAALAEYTRNEDSFIEAVVVRGNWALLIVAQFPTEKATEFRPLIDAMISTLEIQ
jgi:hypothetical protein